MPRIDRLAMFGEQHIGRLVGPVIHRLFIAVIGERSMKRHAGASRPISGESVYASASGAKKPQL